MEQTSNLRDEWQGRSDQLRRRAVQERHKSENLANQLSHECLQQWQRAIEGMLAAPTAAALGLASTTLYVAAFLERGFEILQQSGEALRSSAEQGRRRMEQQGDEEGDGTERRSRDRAELQRGGEAHA